MFSVIPLELAAPEMMKAGVIDYDQYLRLYRFVTVGMNVLPVLALLVLGIVGILYPKHRSSGPFVAFGCSGALIAFFVIVAILPNRDRTPVKADEAQAKSNAHAIQTALDRYATDNGGLYPDKIETLLSDGYLNQFPLNPFTNQQMKDIPYGFSGYYGNFTYLPVTLGDKVLGYYIIVYGYKDTPGLSLVNPASEDHVIMVLTNPGGSERPSDVKAAVESAPR